jgi:glutamate/tyrosine decarboxylase-like PLP-dependent enzyme
VPLNVVCFRWVGRSERPDAELNALNRELLVRLQESGIAVPSSTLLRGRFVMRVALTNHRTRAEDLTTLVETVESIGAEVAGED